MSRIEQDRALRGSQKWLQVLVNECPERIDRVLAPSLGLTQRERVRWLSPLKDDNYAEYRDREFVARLGVTLERIPLVGHLSCALGLLKLLHRALQVSF
jgi:hypothetical protein